MLEVRQAILGCGIRLLPERFPLDLQLDDAPVERLDLFRFRFDLHADPACRLIHKVDRLVGQEPVGDVAVGKRRRRDDRPIRDPHAVVQLVFLLETPEDGDRVLHRWLADEHGLEPALERRVLLDIFAVFVERGRADAVQLTAGKRGLQQVARVHRTFRLTRADQRVHLVYEEDDVALGPLHFVEHALESLLELAAILRTGDERPHVERHQLAILERVGNVAIGDAERQPFHDRGLAHAGIADEHGVVLGPTRQDLNRASDLLIPADDRIELPVPGGLGEVAGEFLQRIVAVLGACRVGGAPAAELVDRFVQRLRLHARSRQRLASRRACRKGERQQQPLDGHIAVPGLLGDLLGLIEEADGIVVEPGRLGRPASGDRGQLGQRSVDLAGRQVRIAAGGADQAGCHALLVLEQGFEDMLRRDALMIEPDCDSLRGLEKALRAVRVLLKVHSDSSCSTNRAGGSAERAEASRADFPSAHRSAGRVRLRSEQASAASSNTQGEEKCRAPVLLSSPSLRASRRARCRRTAVAPTRASPTEAPACVPPSSLRRSSSPPPVRSVQPAG